MRKRNLIATCVLMCAALLMVAPAAQAGSGGGGGNDGEVIRRGSCSGQSDWKVKVKPDDGGLELEFEVDSERERAALERPHQPERLADLPRCAHDARPERFVRDRASPERPGRYRPVRGASDERVHR